VLTENTTYCYATRQDWLPGLVRIEDELAVQFVQHGLHPSPAIPCMDRLSTWEFLGCARFGNRPLEPTFWVVPRSIPLSVVEVPQRRGASLFSMDLGSEPCAVALQLGGLFQECLIEGYLGSVDVPGRVGVNLWDRGRILDTPTTAGSHAVHDHG
jgi:hypothetical protein